MEGGGGEEIEPDRRLLSYELLPERISPECPEEQMGGYARKSSGRHQRAGEPSNREVFDVLGGSEAKRRGSPVHHAVNGLVELSPMPGERPSPQELGALFAHADD